MKTATNHYERAFGAFLTERGLNHIAVDQSRKAMLAGAKLKSFDFILHPAKGRRVLVDVKGRKCSASAYRQGRYGQNWITQADLEGLTGWEAAFGEQYMAAFVFAYWLYDETDVQRPALLFDPDPNIYRHDGRVYAFVAADLIDYRRHMKPRSPRWRTVFVPARAFRALAVPLDQFVHC